MDNEEKQRLERIATQSITVIETPIPHTGTPLEAHYFPVNINQVRDLEADIQTHLELLSLSRKAEDAAKVVFKKMVWEWFRKAQENATTSASGCIAPVVFYEENTSNRWGFKSQEDFEDQTTPCKEGATDGSN